MSDITFTPGTFVSLRAKIQFHLGRLQRDLSEGTVVQFDGNKMVLDGTEHVYPELRAAYRSGWLVATTASNSTPYVPASAGIKVRPARNLASERTVPVTTSQEEVDVRAATSTPKKTSSGPKPFSGKVVRADEDENRVVGVARRVGNSSETRTVEGVQFRTPSTVRPNAEGVAFRKTATPRGADAQTARSADDQGVPVAKATTPTHQRAVLENASAASAAIRKAESTGRSITAGPHRRVHAIESDRLEDLILEISPEDRAQAAAAERRRAAEESRLKVEAEEAASTLPETLPKAPKTAKTPKTAKAPKISKTLTVKAKKAASVASEPLTPPPPSSVEEWIVRGSDAPLAPDVTWDKTLHWKTRVRLAVEKYVDDEKTLELILRYEAPTVAKLIREAVDRTRAARSASAVENL